MRSLRLSLHRAVLFSLMLVAGATAAEASQVNILTLGDSITASSAPGSSYRYYLSQALDARGVHYDFVGSQSGGGPVGFDDDHEGHSGWRTSDILQGKATQPDAGKLSDWLGGYGVDVALVHLGTNDVLKGVSAGGKPDAGTTAENLAAIVQTLRAFNPGVAVVLAKIIPLDWSLDSAIQGVNAQIQGIADALSTDESPILVADAYTGFDKNWLYDGVHPDATGERFIAEEFLAAIPADRLASAPTPATAAMGLALLGLTGLRRRPPRAA